MRHYFNKIFGNDGIKSRIGHSIELGNFPHALLISGADGSGKLMLAKEIASALNCENRSSKNHSLPCHICNTCKRIADNNFLDVKIVEKEKDKATLSIDEIRKMRDDMMLSATESDYRIYIFKDAHLMTVQAQNALLKILEEPPDGGIMILLADEADKILTTIKSRVQAISMQRFKYNELDLFLSSSATAKSLKARDPEGYSSVIAYSEGNIGKAIELMSTEAFEDVKEKSNQIKSIISVFAKKTSYARIKEVITSLPSSRKELSELIEALINALSELITVKYGNNSGCLYTDPETAQKTAKEIGVKRLLSIYDLTLSLHGDCSKNANVSALLSDFAARIATL